MIRFVTGTDTGVGKTVTASALATAHREAGDRVAYYKPVQTGVGKSEPGDAGFVAAMAEVDVHEGVRLPEPLAPTVAAESAGTTIEPEVLVREALTLARDLDVLIVEGAGGLLVPLAVGMSMADYALAIEARLVVVVRPGLGTLNHTALTIEAALARGLTVDGIVVSGWPSEPARLEKTNLRELAGMATVLGVIAIDRELDTETLSGHPPRLVVPSTL